MSFLKRTGDMMDTGFITASRRRLRRSPTGRERLKVLSKLLSCLNSEWEQTNQMGPRCPLRSDGRGEWTAVLAMLGSAALVPGGADLPPYKGFVATLRRRTISAGNYLCKKPSMPANRINACVCYSGPSCDVRISAIKCDGP